MITAQNLLDRMTPSTVMCLLLDMGQVEGDQDDAPIRDLLTDQLVALIGETAAAAELKAAGLEDEP